MKLLPIITSLLQAILPLSGQTPTPSSPRAPQILGLQQVVSNHSLNPQDVDAILSSLTKPSQLDFLPQHPVAAVTPHHLLAGHLISKLVYNLPPKDTYILISPDHRHQSNSPVTTSSQPQKTIFGPIDPNPHIIEAIVEIDYVTDSNLTTSQEHGLTSVTSYLKHFHPQANIVPIIVSHQTSYNQLLQLTQTLYDSCGFDSCFLIASTDFSHNLSAETAAVNDQHTLSLIQSGKSQQLLQLNDHYLDSPQSLVMALKFAQLHGVSRPQVIDHTSSTQLIQDPLAPTTTYFTLLMH